MQVPDLVRRPDLKFRRSSPASRASWRSAPTSSRRSGRATSCCTTLPVVQARRLVHRAGRERSERRGDQADGLPHRRRLRTDAAPHHRRAQRQGGDRDRRAARALRRGGQHQLGLEARGGRRPRGVRRRRSQDAREDGDGRAARAGPARALRAPRHRQLPPRTATLYTDFGLFTCNAEICGRRERTRSCSSRASARPAPTRTCGRRRSRCTSAARSDRARSRGSPRRSAAPASRRR
jgi:hypothetical protein